jgi:6-phosphogluconolactonase
MHFQKLPDVPGISGSTRRDFLVASAAGVIALARAPGNPARGEESQMDDELLYVGSYTDESRPEGIHLVYMNRQTGKLRHVSSVNAGPNPSFLAIHPNGRVLYAVNEIAKYNGRKSGAVISLDIARGTGALTKRNEQSSEGAAPCYVSVDHSGKVVLVANYSGGNVALLPLASDGALSSAAHIQQHAPSKETPSGRNVPHAHSIIMDAVNRFALAADLGLDRVFVYRLDVRNNSLSHVIGGDAVMRQGAGPRHMTFHPALNLVFVVNELDSTVSTLRFDRERGALSLVDTRTTLPDGWTGKNFPGDIHIAPSGRTLYVSNRGHNSISVLSVAASSGALALEQVVSTGGDWPRNFNLDPTGRWLVVANQRSDSVVVLARDDKSGHLTPTGEQIKLPSPACVRFNAQVRPTRRT